MSEYTVLGFTDLRIIAEALRVYNQNGYVNAWRYERALKLAAHVDALADEKAAYYDLTAVYADTLPTMGEALEEAAAEDEAANWQQ